MKTRVYISSVIVLVALNFGCSQKSAEGTTQEGLTKFETYGVEITPEGAVSGINLIKFMEGKDSADAKLEGKILETCEMKGCWMTVDLGDDQEMRVTFKDYGFFVPKEGAEGKRTIFEGTIQRIMTDVETLKHYAEDAGKSQEEIDAITEPKEEIAFVATGVIIKEG